MLSIDLPGNIKIEVQNPEPLFDIINSMGSIKISMLLDKAAATIKKNHELKNKRRFSKGYMLLANSDYAILINLSNAFRKIKEQSIVTLIKE